MKASPQGLPTEQRESSLQPKRIDVSVLRRRVWRWLVDQHSSRRPIWWARATRVTAAAAIAYVLIESVRRGPPLVGTPVYYLILLMSGISVFSTFRLALRRSQLRRNGWISQQVKYERRRALDRDMNPLRRAFRRIVRTVTFLRVASARPSGIAVACAAVAGFCLLILQMAFGFLWPTGWVDHLHETYLTLWQVQMAFAGFALPVLVFVIELAKDDLTVARRTAEVMIRGTLVFPITVLVLLLSLVLGVGAFWLPSSATYGFALLLLTGTVGLTLFAYGRALSLMFDRARLRRAGMRLLVENLSSSIEASIDRRIGSALLIQSANQLGARRGLGPQFGNPRYMVLCARSTGTIKDVNVWHLEEFIGQLPRRRRQLRGADSTELPSPDTVEQDIDERESAVELFRLIGDPVEANKTGLISLRIADFEPLERDVLERMIQRIYVMEPADE